MLKRRQRPVALVSLAVKFSDAFDLVKLILLTSFSHSLPEIVHDFSCGLILCELNVFTDCFYINVAATNRFFLYLVIDISLLIVADKQVKFAVMLLTVKMYQRGPGHRNNFETKEVK